MNKTLVSLAGIAALLVVAYFGYLLIVPTINQCEGIFQQTAPSLETNVKFLESEGGVVLGQKQIQELSSHAQEIALNLKSCCVMAGSGNFEQFDQCKKSVVLYDKQMAEAVETVKSVTTAEGTDQVQKQKEAEARLAQIIQSANEASAALEKKVAEISGKQPDQPDPVPAPQEPGALKLRAALTKDGDFVDSCVDVYDPKEDLQGNMKAIARKCGDTSIFELPAGQYAVFVTAGSATVRSDITVAAGQTIDTIVDLNAGYLRTEALLAEGGERANACFDVLEAREDIQGNRKEVARSCSDQAMFLLPAGDYVMDATSGSAAVRAEVSVVAGQRLDRAMILNAGYLRSHAELTSGGEQVSACFEVYDPKEDSLGNLKQIARSCDREVRMTLPAGDYRLFAQAGHALSSVDVTITAGQPIKLPVVLNAGYLRVQARPSGDTQFVSACFDVYAPKQDVQGNRASVARQCEERAIFTLPAGSYFLVASTADASGEQMVEVAPGGEPNDYVIELLKR